MRKAGRHFLQIPGPSSVPDRILSAISGQVIDHRGPAFGKVGAQAYIRQQSANEIIVSAYREHALAACQQSGQKTPNVSVELIIGKDDLNVRLWQTGHAQWSARYRDPFLLIKSTGRDRAVVCEYDINRGTVITRLRSKPVRAAG